MFNIIVIGLIAMAVFGIALMLFGWVILVAINGFSPGQFRIDGEGASSKLGRNSTLAGVGILALAMVGLSICAIVWGLRQLSLTPGTLALLSIAIGPAPMLMSVLARFLAAITRGQVDSRSAKNCKIANIDISAWVYVLYMAHWWTLHTVGLAMLGLAASLIWAI